MGLSLVTAPATEPLSLAEIKAHVRVVDDNENDLLVTLGLAAREFVETFTHRAIITQTWALQLDGFPFQTLNDTGVGTGAVLVPKPPLQFTKLALTGTTHGSTTVDGITSTSGVLVGMFVTTASGVPYAPGSGPDFAPGTTVTAVAPTSLTLSTAALTSTAALAITASTVGITYVDMQGVPQTWDPSLYTVDAPQGPYARVGRIVPAYFQIYPVTRWVPIAATVTFPAGYGDARFTPGSMKAAMKLLIGNWWLNREAGEIIRGSADILPYGVEPLLWPFKAF